jgi:hypothetical protein
MFNRVPINPFLQQQFADDDRLLSYLLDKTATKQLASRWFRETSQHTWLTWRTSGSVQQPDFKMYVSPSLKDLPQVFRAAVDAFVRVRCNNFKIGRTAFGLTRPDKFVAYFASLDQLHEAAELILSLVANASAQGVPFTAGIDIDGLLSLGMDPPRFDQVLPWQEHQSWRQWVAERVAVYTLAAKESSATDVPTVVIHRLSLDGINTSTWSPNLAIWRKEAGKESEMA